VQLQIHRSFYWRLVVIIGFFVLLFAAILVRVFSLAIVEHRQFALAAESQHADSETLVSLRGTIYAQDKSGMLHPLAIQETLYTLIAVPKNISDPEKTALALSEILGIPLSELMTRLGKADDPYEVISRKLDLKRADAVRALDLEGVSLEEESRRSYPQGSLASAVVGFASWQEDGENGEYGIEKEYQSYLKGERGFFEGDKDASGYWIALGKRILDPPVHGESIVLTLDTNIQYKLEEKLNELMEKWKPESAAGVIIEPSSGKVLALASRPTFDPNAYSQEKDFSVFRNPIIDSQFELGSVFKPITMSGGIEERVVTATSTYEDTGAVKLNGYTIKNFDLLAHGIETMTQVLEKSLNTGAIFVEQRLGRDRFLDTIERFGFGAKTGVDFPGEVSGDISALRAKDTREVNFATASFGQGIAVTPLQMAMAISAIANHGVLMRPFLVEKIIDENGTEEVVHPQAVRQVISPETAETISKMLVSVVKNGFDKRSGIEGYFLAGKTGTALIPARGGYSDEVIHTIIGFAPAFDPKFFVLLQMNKPIGNRFAANTLSSPLHDLAEFMINYYEIPPDTN